MTILAARTMRGVVFDGAGPVLATVPLPELGEPRSALVRVRATGICGTDRAILLGEFPAVPGVVLGHESVGEVVATGEGTGRVRPGDRVVINPTYYCGECPECRTERARYCPHKDGRELGIDCPGTMAEFVTVDQRFLHPLPAGMSYRRAVLIEPLACVLANLEVAAPGWDDTVLVAGGGPIGMLAALVLAARGHRPWLAERDPVRVRLAAEVLPEVRVVHTATLDTERPDVVVDTTGVLLAEAVRVVAPGGTVVVMGEREAATATLGARSIATRGIRVAGAGPYPPRLFEVAVRLAETLPLERLITHEVPLSRMVEAFALLGIGGEGYRAGKVLLTPDGTA
ncbi:zinc-dependent alcohol dehydrogenase [Actinoplanes regularis]|uniref:Threonine dehydrogenase n=1 Tax=Actinoplanes regularis TaxID=52697 RepID=A0A239A4N2_9ACTN|nr:alcohol dehydrogenase catalytic domain-containing protein [Actinoplanes regularis]GIE87096.1 alcohol dehydrogenase [Actinoplanes regularis]SNR90595.1 Threonine dehydrogenase [Actinoplanes regularis]